MDRKVGMVSLGCPKNQVDAEIMLKKLIDAGYILVQEADKADVVIVNTCGFIEDAKKESIDAILEMADFKEDGVLKKILVTGCLAQRYAEEIFNEIPEVDGVIGIGANDDIVAACDALFEADEQYSSFPDKEKLPLDGGRILTTPEYTAYLKIAEGCSNCCTYCAIPSIRGGFRSRKMEDVLEEAKMLCEKGVKEIILVAQDTTKYGEDLYGELKLPELLGELNKIENLHWIRLLYCYPDRITDELINAIAENEKVCKYIDIPMQHADGKILKAMNRRGDEQSLLALVEKLREKIPGVVIRSTFITGFPGEGEEEFETLSRFVNEAKLDRVGCFAYSREEGTPAYDYPDQVDPEIAAQRAEIIMEQQYRIAEEKLDSFMDTTVEVLVEGYDPYTDSYCGRTYMDAPDIDNVVVFTSGYRIDDGDIVPVEIFDKDEFSLIGEAI
ncbi:MAG: 30S ribosomal protein S12 methylthiotransferase RimO [Clostridia bacterium]|nr:30S ribosomal protein S12 methylthiotransferase RimO [Clostridia bacterium]